MVGERRTCHFEISDPPQGLYRFFRVRVPDDSHDGGLDFSYLDVFGTLFKSLETESE